MIDSPNRETSHANSELSYIQFMEGQGWMVRSCERERCLRPICFSGVVSQLHDIERRPSKKKETVLQKGKANSEDTGRADALNDSGNTHDEIMLRKHQKQLGEDQRQ